MKKIVIEISDTLMEYIIKGRDLSEEQNYEMACAIVDGTPLPEHHGRLIDADAMQKYQIDTFGQRLLVIDTAPTIIEGSDSE